MVPFYALRPWWVNGAKARRFVLVELIPASRWGGKVLLRSEKWGRLRRWLLPAPLAVTAGIAAVVGVRPHALGVYLSRMWRLKNSPLAKAA
jgi:hypothetical protein